MRPTFLLSRFIVASLLAPLTFGAVAADAPRSTSSDVSAQRREALKTLLQAPENRGIEARIAARTGVPEFLERGAQPLARAEQHDDHGRAGAALRYVEKQAALFRLQNVREELQLARSIPDNTGRHHYVFQQQHDGVPVRGAQLRAHFDADDTLYAMSSDTVPSFDGIDVTPAFPAEQALQIARDQFVETALEQDDAQLELHDFNGTFRLVYVVETTVNTVNRWQSIIDAHSGDVLQHFLAHQESSVAGYGIDLGGQGHSFQAWERTGRYHLVDVTVPVHEGNEDPMTRTNEYGDSYVFDMLNTEGDASETVASNSPTSGWDPVAVSALGNGQTAYRYFRDAHGRQGIDGRNASLLFAVHYGENYSNAFWNGKWMVFGDGGNTLSNLAGCLDVVAHEMSHGVVASSARLEYENQSGALNESIADLFAVLVDSDNWTVGENCTNRGPGYIRNLVDPHLGLKWQPAHMTEYRHSANTKDGDWGGVHVNSGIPNRAAYLIAEGLSKESLGNSIGRTMTGELYYRALTVYLSPLSQFIDLRRALLLAAADLYPDDISVRAAIRTAFDAVGIVEGGSTASAETPDVLEGQLTPSTSVLNFGDVSIGGNASRTLVFANNTGAPIIVHDVVLTGANFSHTFTNTTVLPGEIMEGTVTFHGSEKSGTQLASLEVHIDNQVSAQVIDLMATVKKETQESDKQAASGGGATGALLLLLFAGVSLRGRQADARSQRIHTRCRTTATSASPCGN